MGIRQFVVIVAFSALVGCNHQKSIKTVEYVDIQRFTMQTASIRNLRSSGGHLNCARSLSSSAVMVLRSSRAPSRP